MTNEIVKSTGGSLAEMQTIARAIASSGLFGLKTPEQALSLMAIAQAEGRPAASAAMDYHIISGKPALKAEAMLSRFLAAGGKVEWHTYTDVKAEATFSHPQGGSIKLDWTLDRATTAGITGNAQWKKYSRAMLRARVISEGIRTVYPGVLNGFYTPEEITDMQPTAVDVEFKEVPKIDAETLRQQGLEQCAKGKASFLAWYNLPEIKQHKAELAPFMNEFKAACEPQPETEQQHQLGD